jgi:hypothetical protein
VAARDDIVDRGVLHQVATRAGQNRRGDVLLIDGHRECDHASSGVILDDLLDGFDPVEIGHAQVHQDHGRAQLLCQTHAHPSEGSLRDHLDTGLRLEHRHEPGPEQIVVVDDENADPRPRIAPVVGNHRAIAASFRGHLPHTVMHWA